MPQTTYSVAALWESLSEDTYFLSPLARKFTHLEKALAYFVEGKQIALGGLVSTETTKRQWKRQLKELTQITVSWLQVTAAKDTTVRAAMIQNVVTAQLDDADPGAAMVFWTSHPLPCLNSWENVPQAKEAWGRLTANDRERVSFYQCLARDALMHYSTIYLSPKIIMLMRRELSIARRLFLAGLERRVDKFDDPPQPRGHSKIEFLDYYGEMTQWNESAVVARDDAQDQEAALKVSIPWHKFLAIINAKLKDPSARSLLETTVSLRRDDHCDLHTWVRTFIMTQELCGQKKISLPYSVWYSYFIHQLTSKEKALPIPLPKTEAAANEYDLRTYERDRALRLERGIVAAVPQEQHHQGAVRADDPPEPRPGAPQDDPRPQEPLPSAGESLEVAG